MRILLFFSLCSKVHDRRLPKKKKARMKVMMMKKKKKKKNQNQNVSPLLNTKIKVHLGMEGEVSTVSASRLIIRFYFLLARVTY